MTPAPRRSVVFSVVHFNEKFDVDEKAMDKYRDIRASILPESRLMAGVSFAPFA